jgi:hypothetical protein
MSDEKDYTEMNGIWLYEPGKKPPVPEGLDEAFHVQSLYGFKVIDVGGKKAWAVGTEDDYRMSESQRLGVGPEAIKPKDLFDCLNVSPSVCNNGCRVGFCRPAYNPTLGHYYCTCS